MKPTAVILAGLACSACAALDSASLGPRSEYDPQALSLSFEVLPPVNRFGWVREEFVDVRPDRTATVILRLQQAAALQGKLRPSDNAAVALPASILASRASQIPGRPRVRFETSTTDVKQAENNVDPDAFSLWLNPGHPYTLQVAPKPPYDTTRPCKGEDACPTSYPPAVFRDFEVSATLDWEPVVAGIDQATTFRGRVVDAAGTPITYPMQLRAISEKGEQSTFAVTCTVDAPENCPCTTPSDCLGAFELRAPSVAQSFTLKLQPFAGTGSLQPDSTTQAPSLICSGLDLANDPDVVAGQRASVALGDVQLPAFPLATRYQISVVEDDDDPISGAQVTFSDTALKVAHLPQGFAKCEASYERSVITDSEGTADIMLLPGSNANRLYRVRIDSPAKSPYLSQVISDYELGPQGGVVAPFRLGRRHALSGTVIAADGKPVPDVTIQAEGIADEGGRVPGSTSSTSTTDGAFVLYVDPGTYNIEVQPHPTSGVPRFTILGREVQSSEEGLEFQAPPATVIDGEIRVPDGHGADGFTVRAYSSLSSNGDNATAVALLRGTALSDENGRFRILIGDL